MGGGLDDDMPFGGIGGGSRRRRGGGMGGFGGMGGMPGGFGGMPTSPPAEPEVITRPLPVSLEEYLPTNTRGMLTIVCTRAPPNV